MKTCNLVGSIIILGGLSGFAIASWLLPPVSARLQSQLSSCIPLTRGDLPHAVRVITSKGTIHGDDVLWKCADVYLVTPSWALVRRSDTQHQSDTQ